VAPPDRLYHGTATRFRDAILREGLQKRLRHHVHLSTQLGTAAAVGQRYGMLVMLEIDARQMHLDGHLFFCSDNGVWLTDHVPPQHIKEAALPVNENPLSSHTP
jgi:putative RNA 2'-phosphotransferase